VDEIQKSLDKMSDSLRRIVPSVLDHLMGDLFRLVEKADVITRSCMANKTDRAGGLSIMALGYVAALSMTAAASTACASSGVACVLLIPAVYSANAIRDQTSRAGIDVIVRNDPQRRATP